jgi:hypothetical protein
MHEYLHNKSVSKAEVDDQTSKVVQLPHFRTPYHTTADDLKTSFGNEMTSLDQCRVASSPGLNSFRDFCGCRARRWQHAVRRVHL